MTYLFLAEGFEEIEAIVTIDILRRAGCEIQTVGVNSKNVLGCHGIKIECDILGEQVNKEKIKAIILPGGMPGTTNLEKSKLVDEIITFCVQKDIYIFAICAAPSILGRKGLLKNKTVTCFPGFESELHKANVKKNFLCEDKNIVTAKGPGVTFQFAFKMVELLKSTEKAQEIRKSIQWI